VKLKRIKSEGNANNSYLLPWSNEAAAICSVGNRASITVSMLKKERFKEVYNVLGGMTHGQTWVARHKI